MRRTFSILSVVLSLSALLACASGGGPPIDLSKLPPIIIHAPGCALPPCAPIVNPTPKPPVVVPPVVEPAPPVQPDPAPVALPPLVNLNIVVHNATGGGLASAICEVNGDLRKADGAGFINFAVRGSVVALCAAPEYLTRVIDLPPGDHRVGLVSTTPPPVVVPPVVIPPNSTPDHNSCLEGGDGLTCVRSMAAKYPQLLQTNTYESCLEFTQRVLAALGPDWGHVGKGQGESQSVPRGFVPIDVAGFRITGVSHDAIKHRSTGQVVDLLFNASANSDPDPKIHGPAGVQWALVPAEHWRVGNPFVPAVPVR